MEKEKENLVGQDNQSSAENDGEKEVRLDCAEPDNGSPKKGKKTAVILSVVLVIAAALVGWIVYNGVEKGIDAVFGLPALLTGVFLVTALGYLLGRVTIKGVSLGTAGVFLVAILFGFLCTLIPADTPVIGGFRLEEGVGNTKYYGSVIQNIGLVMFVGAVGFIAGPKFFRDFKKNFKTYILMGIIIILASVVVAVLFAILPGIGAEFSSGILSGALTSTPGYSAALEASEAANDGLVTLGHAIAYPFGVVGVVLFVQLMPKFLKADMAAERGLLKIDVLQSAEKKERKFFKCEEFGLMPLALAIVAGLALGAIKIPLYGNVSFSLGTTGGVLIMCLIFGHFGHIGKLSLEVPERTTKILRELGLMLFLIGAGVEGGVSLVSQINSNPSGPMIILYGFIGGVVMTLVPMIVGFFLGKFALKLPLLNNLGSITGGMTSTPALGTLINTAGTEDVAGAYASTYPIALILVVLACNLMIGLL